MIYTSLVRAHADLGSVFPDYRKMARGWSNIAIDGSVVLSCWAHQFQTRGAMMIYTNVEEDQPTWLQSPAPAAWQRTPQNRKRMIHLDHAIKNCNGMVKVVVVKMSRLLSLGDLKTQNKTYEPRPDMRMRIQHVNWNTGEFRARVLSYDLEDQAEPIALEKVA